MKSCETISEFGDALEQYNAMILSETYLSNKSDDKVVKAMLIDYLKVRSDELMIHLKNKSNMSIKLK